MTDFPTRSCPEIELLPCPFCGDQAHIYGNEVDFVRRWSVRCNDCNADLDVCEDKQQEAAKAWNTRPVAQAAWQCAARKQGTAGGNDPADCDWPGCGCDPAANKVLEAIDEAGFEIVKKREPLPWDAGSNRSYEPVERLAAEIYESFVYDGKGTKPAWTPGGNGTKQDEARFKARQRLRDAGHTSSLPSTQQHTLPGHDQTMAALNSLTIRGEDCSCVGAVIGSHDSSCPYAHSSPVREGQS